VNRGFIYILKGGQLFLKGYLTTVKKKQNPTMEMNLGTQLLNKYICFMHKSYRVSSSFSCRIP
jgi:hypothetical protein